MALNPKQERFGREYLIDLNGTQAAIRAGYSPKTAYSQAERLLRNAEIQAFIQEANLARAQRTEITSDRVLKEFGRIAFFDIRKLYNEDGTLKRPRDLDEDTAAAIAGIEVLEEFDYAKGERSLSGYTRKVKAVSKVAALESLAKHLGMFKENASGDDETPQPVKVEITVQDARKRDAQ